MFGVLVWAEVDGSGTPEATWFAFSSHRVVDLFCQDLAEYCCSGLNWQVVL